MPTHLKILQVLPALNSGGVERGTIDLSHALVAQGHRSFCVSQGGRLVETLEDSGSTHISMPVHSKNPLTIWHNADRLNKLIAQYNIDLVHVRSRAPAWSVYLASKRCNIPMVSTFHGQYGSQSRLKRWYNSGMLKADTTIAVSDFILSHIRQTYPTHHGRLIRIYRGINTRYFAPTEVNQDMREVLLSSWGLTLTPRKIILLPGRLTRLKGHHLFIEALAMLASSEIHAVIVGDLSGRTSYVEELKTYAESLGINTAGPQQQLHFVGACSDMPTAYSLADVVVSASTKPEAFGRTACEAQAMGKLVVATQHGGSCETLHPSQQAGMCAPGDAQSLSAALERQLAVPDKLRKEIASKSRQHIAANFSLENMCEQTIETYHQILARHTARQA